MKAILVNGKLKFSTADFLMLAGKILKYYRILFLFVFWVKDIQDCCSLCSGWKTFKIVAGCVLGERHSWLLLVVFWVKDILDCCWLCSGWKIFKIADRCVLDEKHSRLLLVVFWVKDILDCCMCSGWKTFKMFCVHRNIN